MIYQLTGEQIVFINPNRVSKKAAKLGHSTKC